MNRGSVFKQLVVLDFHKASGDRALFQVKLVNPLHNVVSVRVLRWWVRSATPLVPYVSMDIGMGRASTTVAQAHDTRVSGVPLYLDDTNGVQASRYSEVDAPELLHDYEGAASLSAFNVEFHQPVTLVNVDSGGAQRTGYTNNRPTAVYPLFTDICVTLLVECSTSDPKAAGRVNPATHDAQHESRLAHFRRNIMHR